MSHALNKRQKIERIYQILRDYPDGLTQSELARRLKVYPSTIKKYLDNNDLPYVYEEDGDKRLRLNPDIHLFRLGFSFDEITMLHIAARLLTRQTNQHNPHAASALRKLSEVIEKADQDISRHLAKAAGQTDSDEQIHDADYLQTLQELTEARTKSRKVTLDYELDSGKLVSYTFSPYFIEPYAPGLTTHVIGFREPTRQIRTFKLERLRNVKTSHEDAVPMPDTFDPETLLEYAWGIWYTSEPPQLVTLKFSDQVRRRVLETRWHRKQEEPEVLEDGSVIWRCLIAEPKEMLYWIRGWGADVEVLVPVELRETLKSTAKQLSETYQLRPPVQRQPYQWLYAKTDRQNRDRIHLLLYHLIDVGAVAHAMWQTVFTESFRLQIANMLGVTPNEAGRFVAFMAALHDLGKASPAYQNKYAPQWLRNKFKEIGVLIDKAHYNVITQEVPHATVTTWALPTLLTEYEGYEQKFAKKLSTALGGHHGNWPSPYAIEGIKDDICPLWDEMRRDLYWELRAVFLPP
ncbi:MAG: CRISPR-associated endonuclease Cas3'', partial [Caldilineaceae bacterium]|nr:CRISPR-associated endonuclease Cas3'' [Caldilineaceae bacterium]